MKKKAIQKAVKEKVRLILNGGSTVLDSATIPIQWYFSDKVIEQEPKSLLFVDMNESDLNGRRRGQYGTRELYSIKERNAFFEFKNHGSHKILVLVFTEEKSKLESTFLDSRSDGYSGFYYDTSIFLENIEEFINTGEIEHYNNYKPIAAQIIDIELPKELFAKGPETKWQKKVYSYVNSFYKDTPRDECDYRKRKITVFGLLSWMKLLFVILLWRCLISPLLSAIASIIQFVVLIIGSIFGFYPTKDSFKTIGDFWAWKWDNKYFYGYLLDDFDFTQFKTINNRKYRIAPFHILGAWGLYAGVKWIVTFFSWFNLWYVVSSLVIFGLVALIVYLLVKRSINKRISYEVWLKERTRLEDAPEGLNFDNLDLSYTHHFRKKAGIKFWAMKVKVCKPYAQNNIKKKY